jgi:Sulfatase
MAGEDTRPKLLWRVVLHPFLFAAYPVLALYAANREDLGVEDLPRPIAVAVIGALVLLLLGTAVTRRWKKGALLASIAMLAFFVLWGTVAKGLLYGIGERFDVKVRYLFLVYGLVVAGLMTAAALGRGDGTKSNSVLNVIAGALVLMALGQCLIHMDLSRDDPAPVSAPIPGIATHATPGQDRRLPDIYFIVLDAYARADVLKDIYEFDNTPFLDRMRQRGFFVAEGSHVSYTHTTLSLPACMNMDFLENLAAQSGASSLEALHLPGLYRHNRVHEVLRGLGYTLAGFTSGFRFTNPGPETDVVFAYEKPWWEPTRFEIMLLDFTPLLRVLRYGGIDFGHGDWRRRILFALENLHVPAEEHGGGPLFVQAHVLAPHAPFVFDADGSARKPPGVFSLSIQEDPGESLDVYLRMYAEQVQGLNRHVEAMVDRILETSEEPPIIAIVSDHGGPRLEFVYEEGLKHNLIMLLLPGVPHSELPHDLNLIHLFPLIFNRALGMDVPMPPEPSEAVPWLSEGAPEEPHESL